jgi:hypothetical protein
LDKNKVFFESGTVKKVIVPGTVPDPQLSYLNALDMQRFPQLSPQTRIKRKLYNKWEFTKDEGMGFDHDHSSVKFVKK